MMRRTVQHATLALLLFATGARADERMEPDDLPDPRPEIATNEPKVVLPAVPSFELPPGEPGFHRPRELRVRGAALLGTEVKVKGYVTASYDCPAELLAANRTVSRSVVLEAIRRDPSLCERLWFYLGDTAEASRDASIWVVDVPRRSATQARDETTLEEFARWLAQPRIAVGDYVVVTGRWATSSSHDKATHGLLVYRSLEHARPPAAAPNVAARPTAPRPVATVENPARAPEAAARPPQRRWIPIAVFNASVDHLNACTREVAAGHHDAAIARCKAAIARWEGNHLAWYTLASAHIAKAEWTQARDAVERAVRLRPDRAMYQQYYGMALYETEQQRARSERAQREHKAPDDVTVPASDLSLDAARDALVRATRLDPQLWRAQYYLGCVHRDLDDARRAAEAFTRAIAAHPKDGASYVALSELYRSWDYFDQALEVAQLGITLLPSDADLWYEVGMAYAAQHLDDPAIVVFGKALAERPGDARSRFHRGQIYLRQDNRPAARRDLEAVVASDDPQAGEVKAIAAELLSRMKW